MNIIPYDFSGKTVSFIMDEKGDPWWIAKEVCEVLELKNVAEALRSLDEDEKNKIRISDVNQRGNPFRWIVNEPGLYRLFSRSNMKRAKVFQRWVFHDVLPKIRKTGSYQVENLSRLEILEMAIDSEQKRIALDKEVKKLKPKADVYDQVTNSTGLVCISDCAKILDIRPHAFSAKLKSDGYCFVRRGIMIPYEQYKKRGWFKVKLVPASDGSGSTYRQTFVTPRGVTRFREIYNPGQRQLRIFA